MQEDILRQIFSLLSLQCHFRQKIEQRPVIPLKKQGRLLEITVLHSLHYLFIGNQSVVLFSIKSFQSTVLLH